MASTNLYLKEKVKEIDGFDSKLRGEREKWTEYWIPGGIRLKNEKGRWYSVIDLEDPIPEILADLVEEITYHDIFLAAPVSRERGLYRFGSAEGKLEFNGDGRIPEYKIKISAKTIDDIRELDRRIKAGSIRPEESYEGAQNGMSRADLEKKLEEAQKACETLSRQNTALMISEKTSEAQRKRVIKELMEAESTWKFWRVQDMIQDTLHWLAEEKIAEDEGK